MSHSVSGQEELGSSQQCLNTDGSHKAKTFSLPETKFLSFFGFDYEPLQVTGEEHGGACGAHFRGRHEQLNYTKQRRADCC